MELIIYDSSIAESKLSALTCMQKYPSCTLKDIVGLTEGNIDTYIGTLTQEWDKILVCVELDDVLTQAQMVALLAKLQNTQVMDDAAAAGGTNTITLASGASSVDDYYNGMSILIDADAVGSSENQMAIITDYNGTTKVATVHANWGTAITTDSNYVISEDIFEFKTAVGGYNGPRRAWTTLMGADYAWVPTVLTYLGGNTGTHVYEKNDLTSTGMAADELTDTGEFTADAYNEDNGGDDYYVAIKTSADGGVGQVKRIESNTANTLTLAEPWDVTPAAASVYQIVRGKKFALWDEYLPLAIETYMNFSGDTYPDDAASKFQRITDQYGGIAASKAKLFEDLVYLEELAELGKVIFTAKAEGVVT